MYFVTLDPATGRLVDLRMVPTRVRRFRVERAAREDACWLRGTLDRESRRFGLGVALGDDGDLALRPRDLGHSRS